MRVSVFRKEHFNAAHRLYNSNLSELENERVFGKCSNANFHGHNYELVVRVTGEIDPVTGYVIDMKTLSKVIKEKILHKFDHKNLNLDVSDFADLNPTAENIAVVIWNKLRSHIDTTKELEITLYETPRNFVTYKGN